MNEEKSVKSRRKRRSLWWLWLLLILAAFAGGIIFGLKLNTLPLPNEVKGILVKSAERAFPSIAAAPVEETQAPAETPAPVEETQAPAETPVPVEEPAAPVEEAPAIPAPAEEAPAVTAKYIGVDAALEIALQQAGVDEGDAVVNGVFRTKDEDGQSVYEVGFRAGDVNYDYVINAVSGAVEGWKTSETSISHAAFEGTTGLDSFNAVGIEPEKQPIGEDLAKEIAMKHAGVKTAEVLRADVQLESGEGTDSYAVSFKTATRSFEYRLDAFSGEILDFQMTR